jgi:hypothetical protein
MPEYPSIANLLAQIAIVGTRDDKSAAASLAVIKSRLVELGVPAADVEAVVRLAVDLELIERRHHQDGDVLAIAG